MSEEEKELLKKFGAYNIELLEAVSSWHTETFEAENMEEAKQIAVKRRPLLKEAYIIPDVGEWVKVG